MNKDQLLHYLHDVDENLPIYVFRQDNVLEIGAASIEDDEWYGDKPIIVLWPSDDI